MNIVKRVEMLESRPLLRIVPTERLALDHPSDVLALIEEQMNVVRSDARADPTERARTLGKPAYTVFTDATLRDLATRMPDSEVGLRAVAGIGPSKLEQYGDELLALLSSLDA